MNVEIGLAPRLLVVMEGRQPPALNLERLVHEAIPVSWSEQGGLGDGVQF
jgi:hypothetical protein